MYKILVKTINNVPQIMYCSMIANKFRQATFQDIEVLHNAEFNKFKQGNKDGKNSTNS